MINILTLFRDFRCVDSAKVTCFFLSYKIMHFINCYRRRYYYIYLNTYKYCHASNMYCTFYFAFAFAAPNQNRRRNGVFFSQQESHTSTRLSQDGRRKLMTVLTKKNYIAFPVTQMVFSLETSLGL